MEASRLQILPDRVLVVRMRMQLLTMDMNVVYGYWRQSVRPLLAATRYRRLVRLSITRENLHRRLIEFYVTEGPPADDSHAAVDRYVVDGLRLYGGGAAPSAIDSETKLSILRKALNNRKQPSTSVAQHLIPETTCFDFWETHEWWRARVSAYWFDHPLRKNSRRIVHLLNQLMRILRQLYRLDTASALVTLRRLDREQIDLIASVFVEPINGSLLASHLSTLFMHSKQQTGLNMKHEANKQVSLDTRHLQSSTDFDPKIFLKMCTSCVKRDIFELMLSVSLAHHSGSTSSGEDRGSRGATILCVCESCRTLRSLSNAWKYYDCRDHVWLRLELPRKTYPRVCEILLREQHMQLVYTSDKNEFDDERLFIDNFVNYYAFYENGQHPLVVGQCFGKIRNNVSILYIFATMNWVMILDSRSRNCTNSISLNQQSLCKSLNSMLFSVFSENCINRVRVETERRRVRESAAYINRGLGIVSNTGINAFQLTHSCTFVARA